MKTNPGSTHTSNTNEIQANGKVEKKSGKRIGYYYIILKSLKESYKNDVIKCLYIKNLLHFGICVIKEGTSGDSKDTEGRDIKDRLTWQKQLHCMLQDKVRLPRLLNSFEENGNYYLVIEYIKGKPLNELCKKYNRRLRDGLLTGNKIGIQFLDYMLGIIDLLDSLHRLKIVHRDVTPANFMITSAGKVIVIDMELSYSLQQQFPSPPFRLGTNGYMSPQQEMVETPSIQEDIFSIGGLLIYLWTGISPSKLVNAKVDELVNKVNYFIPDQQIANIVVKCLQSDPAQRPQLDTIRKAIRQYQCDLLKNVKRPISNPFFWNNEKILEIIQQSTNTLASPLMADIEKGWFSENMKTIYNADPNKFSKAWYASYNLGASGVIYLLSKIKMVGLDTKASISHIQQGLSLIQRKYIDNDADAPPSLHYGSSGIAACVAQAIQNGLIGPDPKYKAWLNKLLEKRNEGLGFMHGLAGQGIANLLCTSIIDNQQANSRLHSYAYQILDKQEKDGSWKHAARDKKNKIKYGFTHGVAGIIFFLLEYFRHCRDERVLIGAQRGLQWLITEKLFKKNGSSWLLTRRKEISPWWNDGAAGIALPFLKAYSLLEEPRYKQYVVKLLGNIPKRILDNNLSQYHGLSGLGEVYLQAYNVLGDEEWFERTTWIVQSIMHLRKHHPEYGPYWIIEHERQPLPGFMTGNSGILHLLLRYCFPNKINFPLLPEEGKSIIY